MPLGASNPGNVSSFSASVAGTYSVVVTDSNGCQSSSGSGTLTVNNNLIANGNFAANASSFTTVPGYAWLERGRNYELDPVRNRKHRS